MEKQEYITLVLHNMYTEILRELSWDAVTVGSNNMVHNCSPHCGLCSLGSQRQQETPNTIQDRA